MRVMKCLLVVAMILASSGLLYAGSELERRVEKLEREVAELKAALAITQGKSSTEEIVQGQRRKARERMMRDSEVYSKEELGEIEKLYQVANRDRSSKEAEESLRDLISKYDKANRTGCALQYLGQRSEGKLREMYLKQAIEDFSDCFYGDGVRVGAYARLYLAHYYRGQGKKAEAKKLYEEIEELYPNAINHNGQLLSEVIARSRRQH